MTKSLDLNRSVWARYAEGTAGRQPMEFLDTALAVAGEDGAGRLAIDLGSGAGNETIALLERGWSVHAVDAEPRAIQILLQRAPDEFGDRLSVENAPFHEASLPEADLVFASLSLPFADRYLPESVAAGLAAVRPGGWFVGVFFGPRDSWFGEDGIVTNDREELSAMLDGFVDITIDESEFDGPSGAGPKHWHWFVVSARRPGPS